MAQEYVLSAAFVVTGVAMVIWPRMDKDEPWYLLDGAEWSRMFLPHKDIYARIAGVLFILAGMAFGLLIKYG